MVGLVLLLAIYPLSLGPAAVLVVRGYVAGELFDAFYLPVFICCKGLGIDDIWFDYARWWFWATDTPYQLDT